MSPTTYSRIGAMILCVLASSAWADQPPEAFATADLDKVVVYDQQPLTKIDLGFDASTLPAATTIIDQATIDRTSYHGQTVDLLRRVPGLSTHSNGQGDIGNPFKLRGFETRVHGADVAVYVDGVSQSLPSTAVGSHGLLDLNWLTPEMIERIEVIEGPFSALYGDQNRAGAINIITRRSAPSSLSVRLGSNGLRSLAGTSDFHRNNIDLLLIADVQHSDGYRANSALTRRNGLAKLTVTTAQSLWSMRANIDSAQWQAPGWFTLESLRAGQFNPRQRNPTTPPLWGDGQRLSWVFTRDPREGDEGLHTTVFDEHWQKQRALAGTAATIRVNDDDRWIEGGRLVYNAVINRRANVTIGSEARRDVGSASAPDYLNASHQPTGLYYMDQWLDLRSYGAFIQSNYLLTDQLKIVGGVRADGLNATVINRQFPAASLHHSPHHVVTPRLGVVWSATPGLALYANQGEGFRTPAATELSPTSRLGGLGQIGGSANSRLGMSTVRSRDVGFDWTPDVIWSIAGNYYITRNRGEIASGADGRFAAIGDTTRQGWQASIQMHPSSSVTLYSSLGRIITARVDHPIDRRQTFLAVPKNTFKAGLDWNKTTALGLLRLDWDAYALSGSPYFSGLRLTHTDPYHEMAVRVALERTQVTWSLNATKRTGSFPAEQAALPTGNGTLVDPLPRFETTLEMRYIFQ